MHERGKQSIILRCLVQKYTLAGIVSIVPFTED